MQRDTLKHSIDNSKWNSQRFQVNHMKVGKNKKRNKREQTENENKMADLSLIILIITKHVNDLNIIIKQQVLVNKKKNDPNICYLKETHFKYNDMCRLIAKG